MNIWPHYVYVLGAPNHKSILAKIGVSKKPWDRLRTLEKERGRRLYLYGLYPFKKRRPAFDLEKKIKLIFKSKAVFGDEFFKVHPGSVITEINKINPRYIVD